MVILIFIAKIIVGISWLKASLMMHDKESACQCRDTRDSGSIPGSGRSPGEGNGNPSYLENPVDRGAWQARVHGVAESNKTEHASAHTHIAPQQWNYTWYHMVLLLLVF